MGGAVFPPSFLNGDFGPDKVGFLLVVEQFRLPVAQEQKSVVHGRYS